MERFLKFLPYIITLVIVAALIIFDLFQTGAISTNEADELEQYARGLVESSEILVNDNLYHGVYGLDEITVLPEGFEKVGISTMVSDQEELIDNLTAHVLPSGYDVYANPNDDSCVYIQITSVEEAPQYLVYYKDVTEEAMAILGE